MTERDVKLRIVLESPPAGVDFGVQKGRGSVYETIEKKRSNGKDLVFEFMVRVRDGSTPKFGGEVVQGATGARFVYIDIGTYAGQSGTAWSRRLKVPLEGITWAMAESGRVLQTRVAGTGRDGGPACGSARDFEGWTTV